MNTKNSVGPLINDNGDVVCDSPCVASMLNKYFVSVFSPAEILIIFHLSILQPIVTNALSDIELSSCTIYK